MKKVLLIIVLPFILCLSVFAQWVQTCGPGSAGINILYKSGIYLYAGTVGKGVYRSSNDGATWVAANTGISNKAVISLSSNTSYICAGLEFDGISGGVFRSSDNGNTWSPANTGIENKYILSLYAANSFLIAGDAGTGIYRSTNNGQTWNPTNITDEIVGAMVVNTNGNIFASGSNFLYISTDQGQTWGFTNGGQYFNIFSLGANGNNMYAGGFQGLIRSTNGGNNWGNRIDILQMSSGSYISSFAFSGTTVFAAISFSPFGRAGVMKSTNFGLNWSFANGDIENSDVSSIINTGTSLAAGSKYKGFLVSTNSGVNWSTSNAGLPPGGGVRALISINNDIYAGTSGNGIFKTSDNGTVWTPLTNDNNGMLKGETVNDIVLINNVLILATSSNGVYRS